MIKQKYNPSRIQLLYQVLVTSQQQGIAKDYDITVDGLKVVQRTSDPDHFYKHEDFILPETEAIEITIYEGTSNRNSRYHFSLNEQETDKKSQSLDGFEKMVEDKLDKERQKWNIIQLKKEKEELEQQLEDSEKYVRQLEEKITALKEKKFDAGKNLGAMLTGVVQTLVKTKPSLFKNIPAGETIAGLLMEDENVMTQEPENNYNAAVGISKIRNEPSLTNEQDAQKQNHETNASDVDPILLYQIKQIQTILPEGEKREQLYRVLQVFAGNPHLIKDVWELFDEAIRQQNFEINQMNHQ